MFQSDFKSAELYHPLKTSLRNSAYITILSLSVKAQRNFLTIFMAIVVANFESIANS